MDTQRLVKEFREQGRSREDLYTELLAQGVRVSDIESAERAVDASSRLSAQDIAIRTVAIAGAVMVGLGVLSFVAANWSGMGDIQKVAVICSGIAVSYGAAWLSYSRKLMVTYEAFMLLANLIYGAGIFLIGQIYNLDLDFINGFAFWAIGAGFAYLVTKASILPWVLGIVSIFAAGSAFDFFFELVANTSLDVSLILLPLLIAVLVGAGYLLEGEDPKKDLYDIY